MTTGSAEAETLAERRRVGRALKEQLTGLAAPDVKDGPTRLVRDGEAQFCWGLVWNRPGISHKTRAALALGMVAGRGETDGVAECTRLALNTGWSVAEIAEILLHVQCYAGLYPSLASAAAARAVIAELAPDRLADFPDPDAPEHAGKPGAGDDRPMNPVALRGLRVRREVLGEGDIDAWAAKTVKDDFMMMFFDATHEYCFGKIWARPGLDYRLRSMLSLSVNAALGYTGAVKRHVRSAVEAGLSKEEIGEILLQVYAYGGVYCGLGGFLTAQEIFADLAREGIAVRDKRDPNAPPL